MIELKDQVCGKEYSEKIQALGVEVRSLFEWNRVGWGNSVYLSEQRTNFAGEWARAYTAAELLEMLPLTVWHEGVIYGIRIKFGRAPNGKSKETQVEYWNDIKRKSLWYVVSNQSIEEALAVLLKEGLKEGWLTAEEINGRCG